MRDFLLASLLYLDSMDAYIDSIARGETEIDEQSQQKPGICEYLRERDGETRHVFQLFCECNEVDQTLELQSSCSKCSVQREYISWVPMMMCTKYNHLSSLL